MTMNVGKIISGSQLVQRIVQNDFPTAARDRSVDTEVQIQGVSDQTIQQQNNSSKEEEAKVDKKQVKDVVDSMNKFLEPAHTALKFEFHEKLDEYYVTIINPDTKEVVKEIPPKKLLDAYASMAELMGFLVDETA